MAQISSFKIAVGMIGIAAFVKLSVFAIALALLGTVNTPHSTDTATATTRVGSHVLAQN